MERLLKEHVLEYSSIDENDLGNHVLERTSNSMDDIDKHVFGTRVDCSAVQ